MVAKPVEIEHEDLELDPEYERKKHNKTIPIAYYCIHEYEDSNGHYITATYNSIDDYVKASELAIREQFSRDLYIQSKVLKDNGWMVIGSKLSCSSGSLNLIIECIESDDKYNRRIKAYEAREKSKAEAKVTDKKAFNKIPDPLTKTGQNKLSYTKKVEYDNFKYDLIEMRKFAKKYGIALPKELAEWKG